ncbi:MAG: class I SAM-dependent methyltransferase [Chlorobi bacterium]|nr:class I SAM-dependent methyltransferase [Chlorobiota bacterium]
MGNFDRKKHWEDIYQTKEPKNVSWYQPVPATSLGFIKEFNIPATAKIIDIGGGDSFFVDHLLDLGYQDITILDISAASLDRAKQRLGSRAGKVKWVVADVAAFNPPEEYDFWHDRAAFHFLTQEMEIESYINSLQQGIKPTGILVIGTFSKQGPTKCSGIEIRQYSEETMAGRLKKHFEKIKCITVDHKTPFDTIQNFIFCSFKKIR